MLPSLFDSTNIPVLQEVVRFAESRHDVLAGNVANMDTPGYRVRDLSVTAFQDQLAKAIEARKTQTEPPRRDFPSPGRLHDEHTDPLREVDESIRSILYHDGSDVSLEHQVTEITKNQFMYNMAIAILSNQFHVLQAAISERA